MKDLKYPETMIGQEIMSVAQLVYKLNKTTDGPTYDALQVATDDRTSTVARALICLLALGVVYVQGGVYRINPLVYASKLWCDALRLPYEDGLD